MGEPISKFRVGTEEHPLEAGSLSTPAGIDGVAFDGGESITHFGVCSTAAGTAAKTVTIGGEFTLASGSEIRVKFSYANTADNPTLNVSGTGAMPISLYGETNADTAAWSAGETLSLIFDGTRWQIVGGGVASTSVRGRVKLDANPISGSNNAPTSGGVYAQLALKAPLDAPTFTGTPAAPTAEPGTDTTQIASTAFVQQEISPIKNYALGAYPTESASGAIASTAVGADGIPLKSLTVQIEPVQSGEGDPSPVNQRPISGWTGANIPVTGVNLHGGADMAAGFVAYVPGSTIGTDNVVRFNRNAVVDSSKPFAALPYKANTQYTFIFTLSWETVSTIRLVLRVNYTDGTSTEIPMPSGTEVDTPVTIVVVSEAGKTVERVSKNRTSGYYSLYCNNSGIFEGVLTANDFVPYVGNTVAVTWQSEAGTVYGGAITGNGDGTWTLTVTWYSIPGSRLGDTWIIDTEPSTFHTGFSASTIGTGLQKKFGSLNIMCDRYKTEVGDANGTIHGSTGNTRVYITDTRFTTPEAFIAAIADAQFVYELVSPMTYVITADSVRSLLGECNVWADCGDVEAVFRCDPTLYIDAKLAAIGG